MGGARPIGARGVTEGFVGVVAGVAGSGIAGGVGVGAVGIAASPVAS